MKKMWKKYASFYFLISLLFSFPEILKTNWGKYPLLHFVKGRQLMLIIIDLKFKHVLIFSSRDLFEASPTNYLSKKPPPVILISTRQFIKIILVYGLKEILTLTSLNRRHFITNVMPVSRQVKLSWFISFSVVQLSFILDFHY